MTSADPDGGAPTTVTATSPTTEGEPEVQSFPLPSHGEDDGPDGLLVGVELMFDASGPCVYLSDEPSEPISVPGANRAMILWPDNYRGTLNPPQILPPNGPAVEGDERVDMDGGFVERTFLDRVPVECQTPGRIWWVGPGSDAIRNTNDQP